jgi:hypothetical protein
VKRRETAIGHQRKSNSSLTVWLNLEVLTINGVIVHSSYVDILLGIFSMSIPGRVGYQCANFYRKLIKDGEVKDSNYTLDDKGEPTYKKSASKDSTSSAHTVVIPKKLDALKEKIKKKKKDQKIKKKKVKSEDKQDEKAVPMQIESQSPAKTDLSPKKLKQITIMDSMVRLLLDESLNFKEN